ncbi:MAG: hypothetical protein AAGU10_13150 [Methanosarcina mazei]|nr:hypothetical protein [Methanosarcina mazei]
MPRQRKVYLYDFLLCRQLCVARDQLNLWLNKICPDICHGRKG